MKCLRCGYCCQNYVVIIVDDPKKGIVESNLKVIGEKGPERCPHLRGDKPGEFYCSIHKEPWYCQTPCASFTQIENGDTDCRMGKFVLKNYAEENALK